MLLGGSTYVAAATFAGIYAAGIAFLAAAANDHCAATRPAAFGSICPLAPMLIASLAVLQFISAAPSTE